MQQKHKEIALFVLVLVFGYLTLRVLWPFVNFLLLGVILAILFQPLYNLLALHTRSTIAALVTIIIVVLLIILPSLWVATILVSEATSAYQAVQQNGGIPVQYLEKLSAGLGTDVHSIVVKVLAEAKAIVASTLPGIISGAGTFLFGMLLMFFVLFYGLKEGKQWFVAVSECVPLSAVRKKKVHKQIELMTKALFFGQLLTAVFIGIACAVVFALFGISNPVFWGFVMTLLAFLPFVGAPLVFVPAGIILLLQDKLFAGIGVIVLCSAAVLIIDTILRPKLIGKAAQIHPLTILLGAIGGIVLMGFVGFIIGPLILNIFMTLLSFEFEE